MMMKNEKCKQCRTQKTTKQNHPFCSFECWTIRENELCPISKEKRDERQHIEWLNRLENRKHREEDETPGLIMQMIKKGRERTSTRFNHRCHVCSTGIRNEDDMVTDGEWHYCNEQCHSLKVTDKKFSLRYGMRYKVKA